MADRNTLLDGTFRTAIQIDFSCSKCGPPLSAKISLTALPRLKSRGEPATAPLHLKPTGSQQLTAAEDVPHSSLQTQATVLKK